MSEQCWNESFSDACLDGNLNVAQFLISNGANNWNEGLVYACQDENLELVSLILKAMNSRNELEINITWIYYGWPSAKPQITTLLYLKTPLNAFERINGFQELSDLVVQTKQAIS